MRKHLLIFKCRNAATTLNVLPQWVLLVPLLLLVVLLLLCGHSVH